MATRKPGGPFVATCPTRELLDQLADKWAVLLLIALSDGPVRFNALKRKVEGITQKMLGQTLRRLERNGLVERRVFATVPVTVEYEVTPLGRSLHGIVDAIRNWSIDHIGVVQKARERFDATHEREPAPRAR
ncbi:winged helix-turn-helix transcriptional regulator [Corallococcus sp. M7]